MSEYSSVKDHKNELRRLYSSKRSQLSVNDRENYSMRIIDSLVRQPFFQSATSICSYCSFGDEVSTVQLHELISASGKKLLLPRIKGNRLMDMVEILPDTQYDVNHYGIQEPIGNPFEFDERNSNLCIIPLIAFDSIGNRLGYGGGFYDTFLSRHDSAITVGLGFACQFHDSPLPVESHDISLDCIIDECNVHYFEKK